VNWPDPPGPLIKPWELVLCESVRGSVSLLRLPAFAGLGSCTDRPADPRDLSVWLSPDDVARLVQASLTATGWRLVWGISANTRRWWSTAGGRAIGYDPRDDAESWAATVGDRTSPNRSTGWWAERCRPDPSGPRSTAEYLAGQQQFGPVRLERSRTATVDGKVEIDAEVTFHRNRRTAGPPDTRPRRCPTSAAGPPRSTAICAPPVSYARRTTSIRCRGTRPGTPVARC
jgi:hypothetical protein